MLHTSSLAFIAIAVNIASTLAAPVNRGFHETENGRLLTRRHEISPTPSATSSESPPTLDLSTLSLSRDRYPELQPESPVSTELQLGSPSTQGPRQPKELQLASPSTQGQPPWHRLPRSSPLALILGTSPSQRGHARFRVGPQTYSRPPPGPPTAPPTERGGKWDQGRGSMGGGASKMMKTPSAARYNFAQAAAARGDFIAGTRAHPETTYSDVLPSPSEKRNHSWKMVPSQPARMPDEPVHPATDLPPNQPTVGDVRPAEQGGGQHRGKRKADDGP